MALIALNAVFLEPRRHAGGETYVRSLLHHLQRIDHADRFVVFTNHTGDPPIHHPRFNSAPCPINPSHRHRRILYEEACLPRRVHQRRVDLAHFPYGACPLMYTGLSVVTIHDTLRLDAPGQVPALERLYKRFTEWHIRARGRHTICVSHTSASRFRRHTGVSPERVHVVHHGVDGSFLERGRSANPTPKGDYLLWVGRPTANKNLDTLLAAYRLLRQRGRDLPRLRLVGIPARPNPRLAQMADDHTIRGLVSFEPPVPHAELPELYARALVFCFPSVCESFGLPLLEAQAAGAATVCADLPVFRELHRDATLYCDCDQPDRFADAIDRLLTDPALRADLEQKGRQNAARYTWQACAENTLKVYHRILNR